MSELFVYLVQNESRAAAVISAESLDPEEIAALVEEKLPGDLSIVPIPRVYYVQSEFH